MAETSTRTLKEEPSLELVLKRNPQERLKREKSPLVMLDELPALIATGYEEVAEEDIVRLKWWGLYHDKPKIGTFMLRIKLPAGRVRPAQLRADRRDIQRARPRRRRADDAPDDPAPLYRARVAAAGVRAAPRRRPDDGGRLWRCGAQRDGLPGRRPRSRRALRRDGADAGDHLVLLRQPRLLRPAAQAQDHRCRMRASLQRAGDQLHLARRRRARRRAGLCASSSAAASRRFPGSPATWASGFGKTRRCPCCARCSTRGRRTCAIAFHASRRG